MMKKKLFSIQSVWLARAFLALPNYKYIIMTIISTMPVTCDNDNYNNTNNYNIAIVTTKTMMKKKLVGKSSGHQVACERSTTMKMIMTMTTMMKQVVLYSERLVVESSGHRVASRQLPADFPCKRSMTMRIVMIFTPSSASASK